MRSWSGIICGPFFGLFCGLGQGSFAIHFRGHLRHRLGSLILRSRSGIICGPFWASLAVSVGDYLRSILGSLADSFGDHLRSILGITCGLGRGLFAVHFGHHLRSRSGIICGPYWGSLAVSVGDHLRYCTVLFLYCLGVDVGDRWQQLCRYWQSHADDHFLVSAEYI